MLLLLLALTAANEFVLAYNDDGTAALTQATGGVLRLVGPTGSQRVEVGSASVADCKARVQGLSKAVKERKFTGVDVSVRGCARQERDTIVRTLKRHSEIAHDAELKAADGALAHPKHGKATLTDGKLTLDGLEPIALPADIKAESAKVAISPSKKLLLVFGRHDGGAALVFAASLPQRGAATSIGLE